MLTTEQTDKELIIKDEHGYVYARMHTEYEPQPGASSRVYHLEIRDTGEAVFETVLQLFRYARAMGEIPVHASGR
jgi:hypothetical protein